jgi:iron complex outermembrane receptor protein
MGVSARLLILSTSLCVGASLLPFGHAYAQATPGLAGTLADPKTAATAAPTAPSTSATLAPVIVTAERRSENSQKVPSTIEHLDGKAIAGAGYVAVTDLQYLVPGLQYDPTNGAAFQIRGVGSQSFDASSAKSVSVVVDDVVMDGQNDTGLIGMADLAGVDVLMGPQGTLFGMNATSGVIAVTTNKPKLDTTEAHFSASYGAYNDRNINSTINAPIGESLALRVTAFEDGQDGYGHNITLNKDVGTYQDYGVRARLLYAPSDRFDILISGDYAHHWDSFVRTPTGGQPAALAIDLTGLGVTANNRNADTADSYQGYTSHDESGESIKAHVKIGQNDLTSITAFRTTNYAISAPLDFVPASQWSYVAYNLAQQNTQKYSEEVHLASPTGGRIDWLVGGIYNELTSRQTLYQWGPLGKALTPGENLYSVSGAIGEPGNTNLYKASNETLAGFGQVKLNLTPQFTIALGGRYTHDRDSQNLSFITTNPAPIAGYTPNFILTSKAPTQNYGVMSGSNFSVRVSPEYRFNNNVMGYFTFSTGYKPGGVAFTSNVYDPYNPETVKSYEAGLKSEWLNHRLRVNIDAFREDFTNFQTTLLTTAAGSSVPVYAIGNAGGLRSQGLESSIMAKPIRSLTLSGALSYTDAYFTNYIYNATTSYTGTQLTNSPKVSADVAADYQHELTSSFDIRAHGDYNYRSEAWTVTGQPYYSHIPAFGLVNVRVTILPHN